MKTKSFYTFLSSFYNASKFFLPKAHPENDLITEEEKSKLLELINELDFYEINSIIRQRYSKN